MIAVDQLSPDALLEHARRLVGDGDDRTAEHALDLRRAASSAYYAVFHELCLQAAAQVSGCPPGSTPPRVVVAHLVRWFSHAAVADACARVRSLGALPIGSGWSAGRAQAWHVLRGAEQEPPHHLLSAAAAIIDLRELRHHADYDRLIVLDHDDIAEVVETAAEVVELLREHAASPAYRGFFVLVAMSARRRMAA
jgi:uncharacterized protein (UPF0332 family)